MSDEEIAATVIEMGHASVVEWLEQFGICTAEERIYEVRATAVLIDYLKKHPKDAELVIYD